MKTFRRPLVMAALGITLAALIFVVVRDHPGPKTGIQGFQEGSWRKLFNDLKIVMGNSQSWFNGIYAGCINAPLAAFGALWGVSFMTGVYGLDTEAAAASISILFVGCMLGSAFYGWISDFLGRRKPPMIMSGNLSLAIMPVILYINDMPLFLANALLFTLGFMGQGEVIREAELVKALEKKKIAGAGLDVFEHEPKIHPGLLKMDNVVILPHIGSASMETRTKMGLMAAENLIAKFKGEIPPNCLNPEIFKS